MIQVDEATINTAKQIVLVANTPRFLFTHLRREPATRALADRFDANSLASTIEELGSRTGLDLGEIALAYLALAALSLATIPTDTLIRRLASVRLEWLPQMLAFWSHGSVPISTHTITAPTATVFPGSGHVSVTSQPGRASSTVVMSVTASKKSGDSK